MIITMLEYKADEHGRTLTKVSQWYPSTQLLQQMRIPKQRNQKPTSKTMDIPRNATPHMIEI